MSIDRSRRTLLVTGMAVLFTVRARGGATAAPETLPEVTVYKSPT
jgi:hypothetical protein